MSRRGDQSRLRSSVTKLTACACRSSAGCDSRAVSRHVAASKGGSRVSAADGRVHERLVHHVHERHREPIDFRAANHADFRHIPGRGKRRLERRHDGRAFELQPRLPRHHDVVPAGQRPPDRVPGPASHDDRLAERQALEALQVLGQAPGQASFAPDATEFVRRDDDRDEHQGSATAGRDAAGSRPCARRISAARDWRRAGVAASSSCPAAPRPASSRGRSRHRRRHP